jgi:hypothetical protein
MMGILLSACWLMAGCTVIDDDLSECDNDYQVDYEIRLVTNMSIELRTQLNTLEDAGIAQMLREHLKTIFTDHAHDVDLSRVMKGLTLFITSQGARHLVRLCKFKEIGYSVN